MRKLILAIILTCIGTLLVQRGLPNHTIIDTRPPSLNIQAPQQTIPENPTIEPLPTVLQAIEPQNVSQPVSNQNGRCGDNEFARSIYMQESSCVLDRVNSIGACGLGQSLPCSKLESSCPDWRTNYDCQNQWFTNYAMSYGGWEQAYNFKYCLWTCYSTRTRTTVNKNGEPWW